MYSYACKDYPGMEACPAHFHTETEDELMRIIEHHAKLAHGENPSEWTDDDKAQLATFIKPAEEDADGRSIEWLGY